MAVDFKTFRNVAPHVIAVHKPVLLRGRPCCGAPRFSNDRGRPDWPPKD